MPRPHDLLWGLRPEHLPQDAPAWARAALARHAPVVVRRAVAEPGWVAVGIRGMAREQRFAGWMRLADIRRRLSPEAIARAGRWRAHAQPQWPALRALAQLAPELTAFGLAWAQRLCAQLDGASGRIDLQLETPCGALALREWAKGAARVLLKTSGGPLLVGDPWATAERSVA
jgi:phosphoribosyl-dephospho-CoA transferase